MSLPSAALAYAKMGLKIFPLAPRSKKTLRGSHGVLDATSDPEQIEKLWTDHPDANIGCNCGESGIGVLDADLYKPMAEEHLEDLSEQIGGLPDTWTVLTGGGGYQYFYSTKHIDGLRSGTDCFGTGLDFKADGGYVVLPPSIHPSGKRYEWELSSTPLNSDIAPIPPKLANLRAKKKPEPATKTITTLLIDDEHIKSALQYIPPENYDQWIGIGMAVKSALGEAGFSIWDNWSQDSTKYDAEEMQSKWNSFKRTGVTAGSLFQAALEGGWEPPRYTLADFQRDTKDWLSKPTEGFSVILAADIKPRELEWLIEGAVAANSCGFMVGHPGTFKSWATAEMMVAVASGSKAFGTLKVQQGPTLAFNAEDDPAIVTRNRLNRIAKGRNLRLQDLPIYLVDVDTIRLDVVEDMVKLRAAVRELQAKLLVLDPLRNLHWVNEDSSTEMTPVLAGVRSIQRETGCSVLLVHHDRKGGDERRESRVRGSNSLEGWRDFALYCDTVCDGVVNIKPYVKGCASPAEWSFTIMDHPDGSASAITTRADEYEGEQILSLLRDCPGGLTRNTIQDRLKDSGNGMRRKDVLRIINYLLEHNPLVVESTTTVKKSNGRNQDVAVVKLSSWFQEPKSKSSWFGGSPYKGGNHHEVAGSEP